MNSVLAPLNGHKTDITHKMFLVFLEIISSTAYPVFDDDSTLLTLNPLYKGPKKQKNRQFWLDKYFFLADALNVV